MDPQASGPQPNAENPEVVGDIYQSKRAVHKGGKMLYEERDPETDANEPVPNAKTSGTTRCGMNNEAEVQTTRPGPGSPARR
ncbi:hypothetical protein O1611_g4296 [Lasiodiplodia mahajangana]|uniref:Uncharacterized protein n=1 Tax=Lasiodiplodia mahajangana TaxID=1108764 RepID=A0ACC2JP95_9PEZI|nr:hypothetical protein O1611_g4296 [Lasiodiplodia mahajangana]